MKKIYFLLLALSGCVTAPVPSTAPIIVGTTVAPKLEASCPKPGVYQAVDASEPVTQRFLDVMKYLGVQTIIRYGDHVGNETIRGKIPKPAELELIRKNGFKFLAVFQHNNSALKTFTKTRGYQDATMMQLLYPNAKVWFYGVDFDAYKNTEQAAVKEYAKAFKETADIHGKEVGVYGSGLTLTNLGNAGLAKYFWVSQSTGFAGTKAFTASKKWHLLQGLPKNCGGINVDFNQVSGYYGAQ